MKRDIKFRGKMVDGKWWIEGQLYYFDNKVWITDSKNINLNTHKNVAWFEVIPESVGQYTGLRDKDGKEIYEGDICSTYNIDEPSNLVDTVAFDDGSFVFQNDNKLSAELRGFKQDFIEVIGNIHENHELLNQ